MTDNDNDWMNAERRLDDGTVVYDHYGPLIEFEDIKLSPHAITLGRICSDKGNLEASTWFQCFRDCFKKKRTDRCGVVKIHLNWLYDTLNEMDQSALQDEAYYMYQGQSNGDEVVPYWLQDLEAMLAILSKKDDSDICRWVAKPNTKRIGPKYIPWVRLMDWDQGWDEEWSRTGSGDESEERRNG